ncbi:MAG: hypothetical protein K2L98_01920 [Bacilli bacterium]|nr:hypothetical protein [Bacilli bacterium]
MYLPRLRRLETVIKEMKEIDPDNVITRYYLEELIYKKKITPLKYGDAWVINLDELYGFLSGKTFREITYTPTDQHNIMTTGGIWRAFLSADPATKIRKLNMRLFVAKNNIWHFVSSAGNWMIDVDELLYKLNPRGVNARFDVPRLRWHDDTVRGFKKLHPELPVTMSIIENTLQSESVFSVMNGRRWIINYDQLELAVMKKVL